MAAPQGWSRWYDDAPEHPKFLEAGHKAGWLYVCGQAYCSRQATDGRIPKAIVGRLTDVPKPMQVASTLVAVGLWHDCGDHYQQHDYTEMQTTAAEREEKRRAKSGAGTLGNHKKWHEGRGETSPDCPHCTSQQDRSSDRTGIAGATVNGSHRGSPEADTETEKEHPPYPPHPTNPDPPVENAGHEGGGSSIQQDQHLDPDDAYGQATIGRLPDRVIRKLNADGPDTLQRLHQALADALRAGIPPGTVRATLDKPALDTDDVNSIGAVAITRIRKLTEQARKEAV